MLKEDQYVTSVNTSEHHRPLTTMGSLVVAVSPSKKEVGVEVSKGRPLMATKPASCKQREGDLSPHNPRLSMSLSPPVLIPAMAED